jgi:arylsulfatase A-like enzyme
VTAWRLALSLVLFVVIAGAFAALAPRPAPPLARCAGCNIVLVSIDTLRADHVGAYGYGRPTTPTIDALARRAVVFDDAVSQSAWTRPAHASMLTGLYPSEHGMLAVKRYRKLAANVTTLPEVLARAGYETAAFTGGGNVSAHFGFDRGFSVYRDHGRRIEDHIAPISSWLDERSGEPFFLFVHGFDPHKPYKSRAQDRAALGLAPTRAKSVARACRRGGGGGDVSPLVDEYDAAVHRGDRGLGRLLAMLERRGLLERTIVVVTSDHGEEFLEHGGCYHIRTLYEEVVRVPLVVAVPGLAPRRVSGPVPASVSIPRTLLELVGIVGHGMPGPSLLERFSGAVNAGDGEQWVVSETEGRRTRSPRSGRVRALRGDGEKLVYWLSTGLVEYFDLHSDPGETAPVESGTRRGRLARRLTLWASEHRLHDRPEPAGPLPEAVRRRLRAHGYLN